jgi:hypothetical protein
VDPLGLPLTSESCRARQTAKCLVAPNIAETSVYLSCHCMRINEERKCGRVVVGQKMRHVVSITLREKNKITIMGIKRPHRGGNSVCPALPCLPCLPQFVIPPERQSARRVNLQALLKLTNSPFVSTSLITSLSPNLTLPSPNPFLILDVP